MNSLFNEKKIHIAIMHKNFLDSVLNGTKTIESRWAKNQSNPYMNINVDDIIYFKFSGGFVVAKATVSNVIFYSKRSNEKEIDEFVKNNYLALGLTEKNYEKFLNEQSDRIYVSFIEFKNLEHVNVFNINKKGFGMMTSWLTVSNINEIKI